MPRKTKETKTNEHTDCDCELGKKSNVPNKSKKNVGGAAEHVYVLTDNRLTTQDNKDNSYNEIGIIHTCESVAINIVRSTATGFMNMFGSSGFDNTIFDKARHDCLVSMQGKLDSDKANVYKVSNIRFEAITVDPSLITMNAYGTLLIKSKTAEKDAKNA